MRYLIFIILIICVFTPFLSADTPENPNSIPSPTFYNYIGQHIQSSSLQFSLYSYKPSLDGLTDTLKNFGVESIPSALMPTLSIVLKHSVELNSRLEIGYWRTELNTPPTSTSLTTTLIPISYQFIYRPVLLYEYLPIYLGVGIGTLSANFQGDIVDLLSTAGISLTDNASTTTGYVILGFDLLQWHKQNETATSLGKNLVINLEFKRMLKTIETTGTQPISIKLDGTAIGLSVSSQF